MKKFSKLVLLFLSVFMMILSVPSPSNVYASESNELLNNIVDIEEDILRERGSCQQLVNLGLLSSRACGAHIGGRPRSGTVRLNARQWECVKASYGGLLGVAASIYNVPLAIWDIATSCYGL
ncbi:hypothetical protein [Ignavigranum ruoffiae]|uniref:hypothetical protein n=1 Tax=Ignavigranum ruoffiae TaxID=89093 RepID=UPI0024ADCE06|nr:hypothetical protein [Ignavigranum ruoffiae]